MDFAIRYEDLLAGIHRVCDRIGFPFRPERLGTYNSEYRTNRRPFADYYDAQAKAAVESAFAWELERFGYSLATG